MRSIPTVTTGKPECRMAAMPATSSHMNMMIPPCTLPRARSRRTGPIQRVSVEMDCEGGRGSIEGWVV